MGSGAPLTTANLSIPRRVARDIGLGSCPQSSWHREETALRAGDLACEMAVAVAVAGTDGRWQTGTVVDGKLRYKILERETMNRMH